MEKSMEMENSIGQMAQHIKDNLRIIILKVFINIWNKKLLIFKDKEFIFGLTKENMKDNGFKIKWMGKEYLSG